MLIERESWHTVHFACNYIRMESNLFPFVSRNWRERGKQKHWMHWTLEIFPILFDNKWNSYIPSPMQAHTTNFLLPTLRRIFVSLGSSTTNFLFCNFKNCSRVRNNSERTSHFFYCLAITTEPKNCGKKSKSIRSSLICIHNKMRQVSACFPNKKNERKRRKRKLSENWSCSTNDTKTFLFISCYIRQTCSC